MKKLLLILLILSMFLPGCYAQEDTETVEFYYPRSVYTQNSENSVIACEARSRENIASVAHLLELYFQGPTDPILVNPFPNGTELVSVYVMGNVTLITLSDDFAQLSGLDLMIACASIKRTVSAMTGTPIVQIGCESAKVDGKNHITIDDSTIQYLDHVPAEITDEPTEETQ